MEFQEDDESDDPVEFLEDDACLEGATSNHLSELHFYSSMNTGDDLNSNGAEEYGIKKSFSKFSHDIRKESKRKRFGKEISSDEYVGSLSKFVIGNSTEAINPLTPYKLPVVTSPALLTPTIRSKANKTDLDRPKHWTSSSITPIRAKRPSPSNKTPRKLECNPVTPKSGPSGQLSFRPTFMKSPHTPTPPLLDDDENNHNIISFESPKQIPKVQEKVSHSRKFREGSLSHLFQHILKETEGLQVQFSVSLPHFPLNQISSSISIPSPEKSKDLLNPRNRIKYWVDLTLHSVQKSGEVFLIYNMTIVNFSPGSVYDLTPGSRVQAYFRRDSLKSLGISPSDFSGNMIRVYDFSFFSSPVSAYDQSQSDRYSHHSGGRMILCTQLCEIVR